jgi:hypothetical protein
LAAEGKSAVAAILQDAKLAAAGAEADLRRELREVLADQVVAKAEGLVTARLTEVEQERIRREFARQMEVAS